MTIQEAIDDMQEFDRVLVAAEMGDADALDKCRSLILDASAHAPDGDAVKIADFIAEFGREHIRKHLPKK